MTNIFISKLDAARRQMETAAILYFNDLDVAAIHTLSAAAYEIVGVLAERRGQSTLVQRSLLSSLPDELIRKVRKAMRTPQNFLKHADRDPEEQLELNPEFTEFMLLDAMATYSQLTGENPVMFEAFANWMAVQRTHWLPEGTEAYNRFIEIRRHLGSMSRKEFLDEYLTNATKIRRG